MSCQKVSRVRRHPVVLLFKRIYLKFNNVKVTIMQILANLILLSRFFYISCSVFGRHYKINGGLLCVLLNKIFIQLYNYFFDFIY